MKIIDPHVHLINLKEGQYHWLKNDHPPFIHHKEKLRRSFTEEELSLTPDFTLAGFVHIEAGFDNEKPWREIKWLESHCRTHAFKSMAFADLTNNFTNTMQRLEHCQSVIGIRNILNERSMKILLKTEIKEHLHFLAENHLLFEIGVDITSKRSVNILCRLMESINKLSIIIDHAALGASLSVWHENIKLLSQYPQCTLKCSGWEMDKQAVGDSVAFQQASIQKLLGLFGENRLMLASNFPVCLVNSTIRQQWEKYYNLCINGTLTKKQWYKMSFQNAQKIFCFPADI